ncbi:MAG: PfkB family carbohydrate kinase [Planctomycetes bacterium]|nr:PfkB family carbohydrate kinase [Planctomycetota bacterium]NUQ33861.1 sugar kinase [Planctomycetaceae bacterium]
MSLLVAGSIAFDTIETPFGKRARILGGAAVHFSFSASYLTSVIAIGIIGRDFPKANIDLLTKRGIDTSGIVHAKDDTFNWSGRYVGDMNEAETVEVNLNSFGTFKPKLSPTHAATPYIFLGNSHPLTQLSVVEQATSPKLIVADTMNLWITSARKDLEKLLSRIDGVVMNDGEARMLTGEHSLVRAARALLKHGLKLVIIKKGEHGALAMTPDYTIVVPAYPTEAVVDPTGAGDSFAGGVMGYLALAGELNPGTLRKALRYGTVTASFQVEDFGLERHLSLGRADIEQRLIHFEAMT